MKIGLQFYTVRNYTKKDLSGTLARVADMGFKGIECSFFPYTAENARKVAEAQRAYGLEVYSCQSQMGPLEKDFDGINHFLDTVNCRAVNVSVLPLQYFFKGEKETAELADRLSALAARYKEKGVSLNYHHHNFEFLGQAGHRQFDVLASRTSPNVKFIIDTYWATKSGESVIALLERLNGKVYGMHLRDYVLVCKKLKINATDCAVGEGVIDFTAAITAAEKAGAVYCSIEQETKTPFQEVAKSIANLKALGFQAEFNK